MLREELSEEMLHFMKLIEEDDECLDDIQDQFERIFELIECL